MGQRNFDVRGVLAQMATDRTLVGSIQVKPFIIVSWATLRLLETLELLGILKLLRRDGLLSYAMYFSQICKLELQRLQHQPEPFARLV